MANQKTFLAYLNGVSIYSFSPQIFTDNQVYEAYVSVYLRRGNNILSLTMSGKDDQCGFVLIEISLREKIYSIEEEIIDSILNNDLIKQVN